MRKPGFTPLALALFVGLTIANIPIGTAKASTGYRIMLAYADGYGSANALHDQLLAQPGVAAVDRFNAQSGTPTLSQLQAYDLVFTFSNAPYSDGTALGNNLADYQDGSGIVVGNFGSFSSNAAAQFPLQGRWLTGGYSPYVYASTVLSGPVTLGTHDGQQPLMRGVATLNAVSRLAVTLATGAMQAAAYSDGSSAIAYKTTHGHTAVGLSAYLGDQPGLYGTGDYLRVIVNTLKWLKDITPPASTAQAAHGPVPGGLPLVTFNGKATVKTRQGVLVGTVGQLRCWDSRGVVVSLNATDESGGSGVKSLTYIESGAQAAHKTVLAAQLPAAVTVSGAGLTTLSYSAIDNANNSETRDSLSIFAGVAGGENGDGQDAGQVPYTCTAPTPAFTPPSSGVLVLSGTGSVNGYTIPISISLRY